MSKSTGKKKEEKKKYKEGDVIKNSSPIDLNSVNFANKNVVKWKKTSSKAKKRNPAPKIAGLKGLGSSMKTMRMKKRK